MQLEIQLGAVNLFLTPRQLHALIQLLDTFLVESTKQRTAQQMDIENDNDNTSEYKAFNAMSGNLGLNQCWSSDPIGIYCCNFDVEYSFYNTIDKFIGFSFCMDL